MSREVLTDTNKSSNSKQRKVANKSSDKSDNNDEEEGVALDQMYEKNSQFHHCCPD